MRTAKRVTVAIITAGGLTVLGAGVAHANSGDVSVTKHQTQKCDNSTKKSKKESKGNTHTIVGSNFVCTQTMHVG